MAYTAGTTPVNKIAALVGSTQIWIVGPHTDAVATVRAANYITDARDRGMRVNDVVINIDTSTPLVSLSRVSAVASTGSTMTA
jgi:hypothetical protein